MFMSSGVGGVEAGTVVVCGGWSLARCWVLRERTGRPGHLSCLRVWAGVRVGRAMSLGSSLHARLLVASSDRGGRGLGVGCGVRLGPVGIEPLDLLVAVTVWWWWLWWVG